MPNQKICYISPTHYPYSSSFNYCYYSQNLSPLNNAWTSTSQVIRNNDKSARSQNVVLGVCGPSMSTPVSNGLQNIPLAQAQQEIPPCPTHQELHRQEWIWMASSTFFRSGMTVSNYVLFKMYPKPYVQIFAVFSTTMLVNDQITKKLWEWGQRRINQLYIAWWSTSSATRGEHEQHEQETNPEFDEIGAPEESGKSCEPSADEMV